MSEIVLFHAVLGLNPGVRAFADALRADGHTVHTPDYYDGKVFATLDPGLAYRDALGMDEIVRRATAAVADLPAGLIYAGFSLGADCAQLLAQTRPGARGALLFHGAAPSEVFGGPWPAGVRLAIHAMDRDPWIELPVLEALAAEAGGELHLYPGTGHLFADPELAEYDPEAAALMLARVRAFVA
ncbi:MAG: dienelactone hydrolase family protein [Deltaproteobacteria bacterium]|nr:dienelactone hydrolase family protein [Deltaproteobacteria bacterium]